MYHPRRKNDTNMFLIQGPRGHCVSLVHSAWHLPLQYCVASEVCTQLCPPRVMLPGQSDLRALYLLVVLTHTYQSKSRNTLQCQEEEYKIVNSMAVKFLVETFGVPELTLVVLDWLCECSQALLALGLTFYSLVWDF